MEQQRQRTSTAWTGTSPSQKEAAEKVVALTFGGGGGGGGGGGDGCGDDDNVASASSTEEDTSISTGDQAENESSSSRNAHEDAMVALAKEVLASLAVSEKAKSPQLPQKKELPVSPRRTSAAAAAAAVSKVPPMPSGNPLRRSEASIPKIQQQKVDLRRSDAGGGAPGKQLPQLPPQKSADSERRRAVTTANPVSPPRSPREEPPKRPAPIAAASPVDERLKLAEEKAKLAMDKAKLAEEKAKLAEEKAKLAEERANAKLASMAAAAAAEEEKESEATGGGKSDDPGFSMSQTTEDTDEDDIASGNTVTVALFDSGVVPSVLQHQQQQTKPAPVAVTVAPSHGSPPQRTHQQEQHFQSSPRESANSKSAAVTVMGEEDWDKLPPLPPLPMELAEFEANKAAALFARSKSPPLSRNSSPWVVAVPKIQGLTPMERSPRRVMSSQALDDMVGEDEYFFGSSNSDSWDNIEAPNTAAAAAAAASGKTAPTSPRLSPRKTVTEIGMGRKSPRTSAVSEESEASASGDGGGSRKSARKLASSAAAAFEIGTEADKKSPRTMTEPPLVTKRSPRGVAAAATEKEKSPRAVVFAEIPPAVAPTPAHVATDATKKIYRGKTMGPAASSPLLSSSASAVMSNARPAPLPRNSTSPRPEPLSRDSTTTTTLPRPAVVMVAAAISTSYQTAPVAQAVTSSSSSSSRGIFQVPPQINPAQPHSSFQNKDAAVRKFEWIVKTGPRAKDEPGFVFMTRQMSDPGGELYFEIGHSAEKTIDASKMTDKSPFLETAWWPVTRRRFAKKLMFLLFDALRVYRYTVRQDDRTGYAMCISVNKGTRAIVKDRVWLFYQNSAIEKMPVLTTRPINKNWFLLYPEVVNRLVEQLTSAINDFYP